MNYWGYRIDVDIRSFFYDEIKDGRLRQGWGYDDSQNLKNDEIDASARGNLPIFKKVKKGDLLLIPHIEAWDEIVIVRATKDFDDGYEFQIDPVLKDYGHIFPVEYVKRFSKYNLNVGGGLRETFKCRSRFWNINRCEEEIKTILDTEEALLRSTSGYEERFRSKVEEAFDEEKFAEDIYTLLNKTTQASEWEFILCEGFRRILPESYSIETTSNKTENDHGADIIIKIPGILDTTYIIAIQVKDYEGVVSNATIEQIKKADSYFQIEDGNYLIDKYLIITRAEEQDNSELKKAAYDANVKIIFGKELKKLLSQMAKTFLRDKV